MRLKKTAMVLVIIAGFSILIYAAQLISEEQGVKDMLPGGSTAMSIKLTAENLKTIAAKIGEEAVKGCAPGKECKYYKGNEGIAIIEHQDGKWGDVEIIVLVKAGKVINLEVLASSEKRGRPIVMRTYLDQFKGKTIADNITIGKNIDAVTGATVSSQTVVTMVKRALALSEIVSAEQAPAKAEPKTKAKKKK